MEEEDPLPYASQDEKSPRSQQVERVPSAESLAPGTTGPQHRRWDPRRLFRRSSSGPRPMLRVKVLKAIAKPLRKIMGSDVAIQISQRSLSAVSASPEQDAVLTDIPERSPDLPADGLGIFTNTSRTSEPQDQIRDIAQPFGNLSQSPTAANSSQSPRGNIQQRDEQGGSIPDGHRRKDHYDAMREAATPRARYVICECAAAECPCINRGQEGSAYHTTSRQTRSTPSLVYSAHSLTEQTEATPRHEAEFSHVGGAVTIARRGGHDSIYSNGSGRTESRRTSNSRPSQISIQGSERASNRSRASSLAGLSIQGPLLATMGPSSSGRVAGLTEPRSSLEAYRTAPASPMITNSPITEEPQEEAGAHPLRGTLRIDTGAAQGQPAQSASQQAVGQESHGNSSVTVTQERQDEMEYVRGSKDES